MDRNPRPQDISWFLDLHTRGRINLDPPYQRKSVWTRGDKEYFLDTIFNNYPCPAVFLHREIDQEGNVTFHVVDGKQRIKTIFDFVAGNLSIPKSFGDDRIAGKKWSELDTDSRKAFWNYIITVEILPDVDQAVVTSVFERINRNSRKLLPQELRHAKFEGWFVTRAEAEAEKQEWKDFGIVTTARSKRMADVQFISELMMISIKREITGFDHDALDQIYAEYENPAETAPTFDEEAFTADFESAKKFLLRMEDANGSVSQYGKTLAHFYSLWAWAVLERPADADAQLVAARYQSFMEKVTSAVGPKGVMPPPDTTISYRMLADYIMNVRGATTDVNPRLERHRALSAALAGEG